MVSLASPALLADRYGSTAYASIAGTLAIVAPRSTPPPVATWPSSPPSARLCLLAAVDFLARANLPLRATDHATAERPSRAATGTDNAYITNP